VPTSARPPRRWRPSRTSSGPNADLTEQQRQSPDADFVVLLEDSAEDLYEHAPCGYVSALLDGTIVKVNQTFLSWTGYRAEDLVGRRKVRTSSRRGGASSTRRTTPRCSGCRAACGRSPST